MPVLFTYDPTTDAGMIRLLTDDADGDNYAFTDAEIAAVYAANGSNVLRTSARLLEILATNHSKLAIKVGRGDVDEDLTQVAKNLRDQADRYRAQADEEDDSGACLEASVSPSYERFSYTQNVLLERDDEVRQ
jgi:hypothetical protein